MHYVETFLLAFIPLFVAVDPIGLTSLFLVLSRDIPVGRRHKIANQSVLTAALVTVGFMFLGQFIFKALGISIADFQIAGGFILLGHALYDMLVDPQVKKPLNEEFGVVPLGLPLIAGPATLTTVLVLTNSVGIPMTIVALGMNLVLTNLGFRQSQRLQNFLGRSGLRALSQIIALLLVAIAINMIRRGIQSLS